MTTTTTSRKRTALLMGFYTFLLALGAAMPLAASYQPGMQADEAEGEIQCGGQARVVDAETPDEDEAGERPRRRALRTSRAARPVRAVGSGEEESRPAPTRSPTVGERGDQRRDRGLPYS